MQIETIRVSQYYGNAKYYPFMPISFFNALEAAFLKGNKYIQVPAEILKQMVSEYSIKTQA